MSSETTTYSADDAIRLDVFLSYQSEIKSRSAATKLIKEGAVKVAGKTIKKPSVVLQIGQVVTVAVPEPSPAHVGPLPFSVDVLYEDDVCMVIGKPRNVVVHPAGSHKGVTLLDALEPMFADRKLPFSKEAVLVHRLDKETTGCLLIAKTAKVHMLLQQQFAERSIEKRYLALVYGIPEHPTAVIDAPIGRHTQQRQKMSVMRTVRGRHAQTTYSTLCTTDGAALLECDLHTGRTHQLRVHLSTIGHPILGDDTYHTPDSIDRTQELGIDFLALHAWKLSFDSPEKKRVNVECPIPKEFVSTLKKHGLSLN